ncbi:12588_t:CDS:2 [Funneliformis caledonium]|uniref:12588_t:CDS:1 n=1 Tax=Funneliformis caledonium TaxID=1117310 RepID=A0A9N9H4R3_9GLOM|nr:12588_t:CDS:2 [Funneliformis caledonium]
MSKRWKPLVTLIATGVIVPYLHFGPFLKSWWHVRMSQDNGTKIERYYPFRLGMKTQVKLKNRPLTIRVVQGNKHNSLLPGFLCESLLESNEEVENDPTSAISKLYKKIFQNETRFSRVLVMGMEDNNILDELVMIHSIGIPTEQRDLYGFASSFLYYKSKERVLFFQTVDENGYSICVYKENQLSEEFRESDSYEFWIRSSDPESDKVMINMLYQSSFLRTIPKHIFNATEVFWKCFEQRLSLNKCVSNGKQRILSIIEDKFPYKELQTRLHVNTL